MSRITHQYRIYPYYSQAKVIEGWFELCRKQYNYRLAERRDAYKENKASISALDQQKDLQNTKEFFPEYKKMPSHVLQDVVFRVDKSFKNFFSRCKAKKAGKKIKAGFPRFKGNGQYSSITSPDPYNYIKDGKLNFPKLSPIKIVFHRPLPEKSTIKTCTISKKADGWYVSFSIEVDVAIKVATGTKEIGIDVGLESFMTTSDGESIPNPRNLKKALKSLRRSQRNSSRKVKGSKNREKQNNNVAQEHLKVSRRRSDFQWKVIANLLPQCSMVTVEKLNIKNMVKNHKLARSISDAAWSSFISKLKFKAANAGVRVIEVDPRGTSQRCSQCGEVVKKELRDRWHICPYCGLSLHRDHNAALNILKLGQGMPEDTPVERPTSTFRYSRKASRLKEAGTVLVGSQ